MRSTLAVVLACVALSSFASASFADEIVFSTGRTRTPEEIAAARAKEAEAEAREARIVAIAKVQAEQHAFVLAQIQARSAQVDAERKANFERFKAERKKRGSKQ